MYGVLGSSVLISLMVTVPKMEIYSPGRGVMAKAGGTVTEVSEALVVVDARQYPLFERPVAAGYGEDGVLVFPTKDVWQEPAVKVGQEVKKKELLAKGVTRIYFQANIWIFAVLVILL